MALKILLVVFLLVCLVLLSHQRGDQAAPHVRSEAAKKYSMDSDLSKESFCPSCHRDDEVIQLSVVACGDRMPETVVLLKSALLVSLPTTRFHFHIFAEPDLLSPFQDELLGWPAYVTRRFNLTLLPISFPETEDFDKWKTLFKPCASQRLFIPHLLTDVDRLLYIDTDVLFLRPAHEIWSHFRDFNASQLAALSPEHEDKNMGWYNRFALHPFYGALGVNSGVMLMHLQRIRVTKWEKLMIQYQEKYKAKLVWGDQDLINVYFSQFPENLYVYGCRWNYRPDHCMYMQNCHPAVEEGVSVLHGSRRAFHNDKQPAFKAVYEAIAAYDFARGDAERDILSRVADDMERLKSSNRCAAHGNAILKSLQDSLKNAPVPED